MAQASPAVCEIDECGVLAIGRCATCKRAFCASHQARVGYTRYDNQCAPCLAKIDADRADQTQKAQAKEEEAREYIQAGAAKTALLRNGVAPVEIYCPREDWKKGFFGLRDRAVVELHPIGRGWILGEFRWKYWTQPSHSSRIEVQEYWLTALLEDPRVHEELLARLGVMNAKELIPIARPYLDGYAAMLGAASFGRGQWAEARQAVGRLASSQPQPEQGALPAYLNVPGIAPEYLQSGVVLELKPYERVAPYISPKIAREQAKQAARQRKQQQ